MTRFLRPLLTGAVALAATPPAVAETVVQDVTVTASIEAACTVDVAVLDFGTYEPPSGQSLESSAPIKIVCPYDTFIIIQLDGGSHHQGNDRHMASGGGDLLRYNLYYTEAGMRRAWGGDLGFGEARRWYYEQGNEAAQVLGELPAGQSVPPGFYMDTVTITVDIEP